MLSSESPNCTVCGDTGEWTGKVIRPDGTYEYRFSALCPNACEASKLVATAKAQARYNEILKLSQSPARYTHARLSDVEDEWVDRVMETVNKRRSLFLSGTVGTGKTHLAVALLTSLMECGQTCLYVPVPDFLTRLRATYNVPRTPATVPTDSENTILATCRDVDWLCLDDLGAENPSDWSRQIVYQVINSRYLDDKPMVITSNLSLAALSAATALGERTVSRLRETCDVIVLSGRDRRIPLRKGG